MSHRVREHVERFNTAQRAGDWAPFVATFTQDAVMSFPWARYEGREAITQAYEQQPPSDTMRATSLATDGDTDVVRFAWDAGGTGTMTLRWRDGRVAGIHIAFD